VRPVARLVAAIGLVASGANAHRVCGELQGKNAEVCREAARNKLYGTRKVGIEHYFVGR
jgi:hypothetical protein